jgi:hypothetical protein
MAQVICNDGTLDVSNGEVMPCLAHGGVSGQTGGVKAAPTDAIGEPAPDEAPAPANKDLTSTQKWGLVVGLTLVAYFILYKAGSLK